MKRALMIASSFLAIAALTWANWPIDPLPTGAIADRIVVLKSDRKLELYRGQDLLRSYSVSLGREPIGPKRQQHDKRTPEGIYRIDYHKPDSSYHNALHISYPQPEQVAAAQFRGVSAGDLIMVHGLPNGAGIVGRLHLLMDWTVGCIAVTNAEIDEIARVVPDGTPIEIKP